jgi:flagellar M-ring protein FliF
MRWTGGEVVEFLRQFIAGVQEAWQRLNASARVVIATAALFVILLFAFIIYYGSQPQYITLYSGLNTDDAGAVQSYLQDQNIPFQVKQGGSSIQVPVSEAGRVRLDLASQGLPRSQGAPVGFEIFDNQTLTTSESLQAINLRRAIQGAAEKQLNQFAFVNKSWVTITEAKDSLFIDEQKPSVAAVTLDLNRPISPAEIKGVLHVVSSFGGANLSPDNITLVSASGGPPLHVPAENDFAAIANSKFEMIRQVELEAQKSIESALRDIGVKSVARVSAKLDFDHLKETSKTVTEGKPESTYTVEQSSTTTQSLPQGAPGVTANPPEGQTPPGATETNENTTTTLENNLLSTKTMERTVTPGNITGFKVAVMVAQKFGKPDNAAPDAVESFLPRTEDEISKYRLLAATAAGHGHEVDPEADVSISDVPMPEDSQIAQAGGTGVTVPFTFGSFIESPWPIVQAIVIIIMALLLRRWLMRATVREEAEEGAAEAYKAAPMTPEDLRRREMMNDIEKAFTGEPDNVANILRTWMKESE